MYDYRCKDCENLGQCMSMMNMPMMNMPTMKTPMTNAPMMNMPMMNSPMMNMPMMNMPMMNSPMMNMPMMNSPMMNMPMMNMPMMNMPIYEDDNEDLICMYPKIYIMILPMVKHHYDIMISKYGKMYCPDKDEMDCICKEIVDKYKEHHKDDDDCKDDDMRQGRFGYGGGIGDIARILLIGSLIGGRSGFGF